jgi:hypothetical protein
MALGLSESIVRPGIDFINFWARASVSGEAWLSVAVAMSVSAAAIILLIIISIIAPLYLQSK